MTALPLLIGLIVRKVEKIHDYIQIVFSDGTTLSIFNNHVYDGDSIVSIEGKEVKSVDESAHTFVILFENNESLLVGLKHDDYHGPEAMILRVEGKSPIVWN